MSFSKRGKSRLPVGVSAGLGCSSSRGVRVRGGAASRSPFSFGSHFCFHATAHDVLLGLRLERSAAVHRLDFGVFLAAE